MITFGHYCPHCGVEKSGFEVKAYYENKKYSNLSIFSILATCNTCSGSIIGDIKLSDDVRFTDLTPKIDAFRHKLESSNYYSLQEAYQGYVSFYPDHRPKTEIPEHLPSDVLQKMRSAEKLYIQAKSDADMFEYTGTAYRATLEKALASLDDGSDKNLNWRINSLVSRGILVKSMGDFAHRIRSLGNDATHNEITLEELEQLRLFTQLFLQYTFTLPAMIPAE